MKGSFSLELTKCSLAVVAKPKLRPWQPGTRELVCFVATRWWNLLNHNIFTAALSLTLTLGTTVSGNALALCQRSICSVSYSFQKLYQLNYLYTYKYVKYVLCIRVEYMQFNWHNTGFCLRIDWYRFHFPLIYYFRGLFGLTQFQLIPCFRIKTYKEKTVSSGSKDQ